MLCRIKNHLLNSGVLDNRTISETFRYLSKIIKKRKSRKREEWDDVETLKYIKELKSILKNIVSKVGNFLIYNVKAFLFFNLDTQILTKGNKKLQVNLWCFLLC